MAAHTMKSALAGTQLAAGPAAAARPARNVQQHRVVAMGAVKKINAYDAASWSKGIGSVSFFSEDREADQKSTFKKIEEKKLLSLVESLGLLSKAEAAGFTLSKIESMGLLSTAEDLGLLSLAEDVLVMEPAKICSASLPLIVAAIAAASLIPHDNAAAAFLSYSLAATSLGAATAVFVTGLVVGGIQEE